MERTVVLPIPPCLGLEVSDGDWSAAINSLYLPIETGVVEAWSEDKEIYNAMANKQPHRSIQEITKEYEEAGWQLRKTTV